MKQEEGFTLIETMLVLFFLFLVMTVTCVSFQPLHRHVQINHFLNQLRLDASYAQLYAISHNCDVHISFIPEKHQYLVQTGGLQPSLIKRTYSKKFELQLATLPATVTYLQSGMIRTSGKMHVNYDGERYMFVFLFGKGQTYFEKL